MSRKSLFLKYSVLLSTFLLVLAVPLILCAAEKDWNVGYAEQNLLPSDIDSKVYYLGGWGEDKPVAGVFDPLWVRCFFMDAGKGQKVALVALDFVGYRYNHVLNIRKRLEDWCKENNVAVHIIATHNHASLDTIGIWGPPGKTGRDDAYLAWTEEVIADCVKQAAANASPGTLTLGQIMAHGMVVDDSPPKVANEQISVLRFEPNDSGKKPIWFMHFTCHPEGLGKPNHHVSSDFVHATREIIEKTKDCHALYINGAVGTMQTVPWLFDENGKRSQSYKVVCDFGRKLGEYALNIGEWTPISAELLLRSKVISVPIYNLKLQGAGQYGIILPFLPGEPYESDPEMLKLGLKDPNNRNLPTFITEVSYMRLGDDVGVCFIPGELAPELTNGRYLEPDNCVNPHIATEKPLFDIMPDKTKLIFGLADDEIGYIVPANNYYISPKNPWVPADDKFGRGHYPETNGTGPETPTIIVYALEELVK